MNEKPSTNNIQNNGLPTSKFSSLFNKNITNTNITNNYFKTSENNIHNNSNNLTNLKPSFFDVSDSNKFANNNSMIDCDDRIIKSNSIFNPNLNNSQFKSN
jgi:hypothetical protein